MVIFQNYFLSLRRLLNINNLTMKSDIEIARSCSMKRIEDVAATIGISADSLEHYGKYMAKVPLSFDR